THIQRVTGTTFIFAGSERHLLQRMFAESGRPFYNSASMMHLGPIPRDLYRDFVAELFRSRGKDIESSEVDRVYELFEGHTYYMQKTFNTAFGNTAEGSVCTAETISLAVDDMIASFDPMYRSILSGFTAPQKELLSAIARQGRAKSITSSAFIKANALQSASSVQAAAKKLMEKDLITVDEGVYRVTDRLLAIWLDRVYGPLG
ncbi:MAG: ATPase, partial [Duncaniella sp.]|nr:ATPase [Duncaniella sp.]